MRDNGNGGREETDEERAKICKAQNGENGDVETRKGGNNIPQKDLLLTPTRPGRGRESQNREGGIQACGAQDDIEYADDARVQIGKTTMRKDAKEWGIMK